MSDLPDIAVVIPCFNNEEFLRQAIESVLSQQGVVIEIVVVDDGSTDGSVGIAESFGPAIRVIQQTNQGACVARNRGLAETSAPYVKFLDADDYLTGGNLQAQFETISLLPWDALVFGDAEWVDASGLHLMNYQLDRSQSKPELSVSEVIELTPLTSCPLHRRMHLDQVGGFDSRCLRSQEFDLHVRLALAGFRFVYLPGRTYHYRQHEVGTRVSATDGEHRVQQSKFEALERLSELAKNRPDCGDSGEVSKALSRVFWRNGRVASRSGNRSLARHCFMGARSLSGTWAVVGSPFYCLLARVVRPEWLK